MLIFYNYAINKACLTRTDIRVSKSKFIISERNIATYFPLKNNIDVQWWNFITIHNRSDTGYIVFRKIVMNINNNEYVCLRNILKKGFDVIKNSQISYHSL